MNTDKPSNPAGAGRQGEALKPDLRNDSAKKTPAADMQADEGSEASAASKDSTLAEARPDARSTAASTPAESVMKQEHKTDAERRQ